MRREFQCRPLGFKECPGGLSLTPNQHDAFRRIVRITSLSKRLAETLGETLAQHPDVPGSDYSCLDELISEEPEVVMLACLDGDGSMLGIGLGSNDLTPPCRDRRVARGVARGFISEEGMISPPGQKLSMILAVLVDPFNTDPQGATGKGIGGALIAAHMAFQAQRGSDTVLGFCPTEGNLPSAELYKKLLQKLGFTNLGRSQFGPVNCSHYHGLIERLGDSPQGRAYALRQSMGEEAKGKHVFHAMSATLLPLRSRSSKAMATAV